MNNDLNNTYIADPKLPDYRRNISLIGLGLFAMITLNLGTGHLFKYWLVKQWPIFADTTKIWYWLADMVAQYGISFPAGMLIIRRASMKTEVPKSSGKPNLIVYIPVVFAGIYAGSMISRVINNITDSLFGATSSIADPQVTGLQDAVMITLLFAVAAPIMEELLFRRILIDALRPYGEKTAIIISSLAFALAHRNIAQMFYAFITGIALGYVYLRSGKIRYGIIIHSIVNIIGSVLPLLATGLLVSEEAYAAFLEAYENFLSSNASPDGRMLTELLESARDVLPGLSVVLICNALLEGLSLAGLVLLFIKRRNIHFNKGEITVNKADIGYVFFEAPGMIAFILMSVTLTVLTFFAK